MKNIQIKVDRQARVAAIYVSGKLINLSIPLGWKYFYISKCRLDYDENFIGFLNAVACETEEELEQFRPILEKCVSFGNLVSNWRGVLDIFKKEIAEADDSKIRPSDRSIAVVYKFKLVLFVKDKEGDYCADGVKISDSRDTFLYILKAALCETEQELEIITPMLNTFDATWKEKAKTIKNCLIDNLFE